MSLANGRTWRQRTGLAPAGSSTGPVASSPGSNTTQPQMQQGLCPERTAANSRSLPEGVEGLGGGG